MTSRIGILAALAVLAACAPAPVAPPAAPAPEPIALTGAEIDRLAELIRLEDRREIDLATLRRAAGDGSAVVRARTAVTLGRIRAAAGIPLLAEMLEDPDTAVAAAAAFAAGQIGDTSAVPALIPLLEAPAAGAAPSVASEAAYALGKLRSAASRAALRRFLSEVGPDATDPEVVGSALLAIWRFPRSADPDPIERWLDAEDPEIRWRATYALVRRPDPAAAPVLMGRLDDADHRARALAVRGLTAALVDSAGLATDDVLPRLVAALDDPAYVVRINAINALATYDDPRAVEELRGRLSSGYPHEVLAAAEALGRVGARASSAAPSLRSIAEDEEAAAAHRAAALEALGRVAPGVANATAEAVARSGAWRLRAAAARVRARAGAVPPRQLLGDADPRVVAAALGALADAAGDDLEPLRPVLTEAVTHPDIGVRSGAIRALGRLGDPADLPLLLDAYVRAAPDVENDAALAAIQALAALRPAGVEPARAFFGRFDKPHDPLVVAAAHQHFGEDAERAWGPALPIETGRTLEDYRALVRRWVAPALALEPAPVAEILTQSGLMRLRLFAAEAPLTVQNLDSLAAAGYFDGLEWPRVVPAFVVQDGDPRGDTGGGPGYSIRDEINRWRYGTGTLGMALSGPDTGGSQFFVTHWPQPHLDGIYTVFGEVVTGQEVTERILPGEVIERIRVEREQR